MKTVCATMTVSPVTQVNRLLFDLRSIVLKAICTLYPLRGTSELQFSWISVLWIWSSLKRVTFIWRY